MSSAPLQELAREWREDAERFRTYGAEQLATACAKHADDLEAALAAREMTAVTLEEAAEMGGYSYSHLQHLVAEGKIENVGSKGEPRIRRADVPVKAGHTRRTESRTKGEVLEEDVLELRRDQEAAES